MSSEKAILWLDLETTGVDEIEDEVIEVGAILTDFEFNTLNNFTAWCKPSPHALSRLLENDTVREMHTKNGLLDIIQRPAGLHLRELDEACRDWCRSIVPAGKVILAGSGVGHFDRRFVDSQLWLTAELLIWPTLGVDVFRRFLKYAGIEFRFDARPRKTHRALDDIKAHLHEAREYRKFVIEAARNYDA